MIWKIIYQYLEILIRCKIPTGCQPCDKPGHVCDPVTGWCVCPPLTTGPQCGQCQPNTWGHDRVTGCKVRTPVTQSENEFLDNFDPEPWTKIFLYASSFATVIHGQQSPDSVTWLLDSAPVRRTTQVISVTSAHLASTITRTVSSVCVVLMVPTLAAVTIPRGSVSVITGGSVNARYLMGVCVSVCVVVS